MMFDSSLQEFLLAHLLQMSLAIVVAAGVIHLSSRRLPHFAFLVCMLALIKCLVPPLITSPAGLFTWHSSLAFAPEVAALEHAELLRLTQTAAWADSSAGGAVVAQALDASSERTRGKFFEILVLATWGLGALVFLGIALRKYYRVRCIVGHASPAPREFREMAGRLSAKLGIRSRVRILVSNENFGPACIGVFRPTVILPKTLVACWSERLLMPVIAHELVHARRRDAVWGYMQFAAQVIWWFHPLVWWMGRRAQLLCERCCDEEVVTSLQCSRADYAESLVRVLELRSVFRPVPLCRSMSPAEITGQRLRRLSQRDRTSHRTSRRVWVFALLLAAIILPGMHWTSASVASKTEALARDVLRIQVEQAIKLGHWETAIEILEPHVAREPNDSNAIFFLGYALHAAGRLDEALEYHRLAATFEAIEPVATYNIACALALKGDGDQAVEMLMHAVSVGFVPNADMGTDSDLCSLVGRPDFSALNAGLAMYRQATAIQEWGDATASRSVGSPIAGSRIAGARIAGTQVRGSPYVADYQNVNPGAHALNKNGSSQRRMPAASMSIEAAPVDRQVRYEGTLSVPGSPPISTRVVVARQNGGWVELVECSLDGQTWTLHRRDYSQALNYQCL